MNDCSRGDSQSRDKAKSGDTVKDRDVVTISFFAASDTYQLECGPMPNVMAAQPNIGGALCESSVIPFLVQRRKLWVTHTTRVPCSKAANIGERKTWT